MVSENYARNCVLQTRCDDGNIEPPSTEELKRQDAVVAVQCSRFDHQHEIESTNEVNETTANANKCFVVGETNDEIPRELQRLMAGFYETLPNTTEVPPLPRWANIEKVKKGQQFGLKYLYGLNYSQTLSLLYLFATPDGLKPLIFTEKSHTPFLAHKRYLSTALRVKSWYETEFWRPSTAGYENLVAVKSLHLNVSKRLGQLSAHEIDQRCNLERKLGSCSEYEGEGAAGMLCPLQRILKTDFENQEAGLIGEIISKINSNSDRRVYLNQTEMSMTQFGFFGLMLVYPDKFAAKNASREELECFVHMWKLLGYLLGIRDEYNFCDGDFSTVVLRSKQFIEYIMKPMLFRLTKDWEHMARCAFQDIPSPKLFEFIGWKELIMFNFTRFVMTEGHRIPGFAKFFNYKITKTIEKAQKDRDNELKCHS